MKNTECIEHNDNRNKKSPSKGIKSLRKTLTYKPSPEYVRFYSNGKFEKKEEPFLDKDNFHLQIGKMQKNGGTLYNDLTLKLGIEYMIKYTKPGHQSVIQIRSDVGKELNQNQEYGILTAREEKERVEKLIKKLGGEGIVKVEIGSEKYPNVFRELKKGKDGIIPESEPNIEKIIQNGGINSPLPIIQYLAFHANKDPKLMELFYNTKPEKYIGRDKKEGKKPGDSDEDFYGIVEVGLRLFDILNGASIQGGLGRQREYDRILSLIIYGRDNIDSSDRKKGKDKETGIYGCIDDYKALKALHIIRTKYFKEKKFDQLYIELDDKGIEKENVKISEKDKLKRKTISALAAILLLTGGASGGVKYNQYKNEKKQQQQEQEYREMDRNYQEYLVKQADYKTVSPIIYEVPNDEPIFLRAAYDIGSQDYIDKDGLILNHITDEYGNTTRDNDEIYLSSQEFFNKKWRSRISQYHIAHQQPYEHLLKYKQQIQNTLKLTKEPEKIKKEKESNYFYYDKIGTKKFYKLKFVTTETGDQVIYAAEINYYDYFSYDNCIENYSREAGQEVAKGLENYRKKYKNNQHLYKKYKNTIQLTNMIEKQGIEDSIDGDVINIRKTGDCYYDINSDNIYEINIATLKDGDQVIFSKIIDEDGDSYIYNSNIYDGLIVCGHIVQDTPNSTNY